MIELFKRDPCLWMFLSSIFFTAARIGGQTYRLPFHFLLVTIPFLLFFFYLRKFYLFCGILIFILTLSIFHLILSSTLPSSDIPISLTYSILPYNLYYVSVWSLAVVIGTNTSPDKAMYYLEKFSFYSLSFGCVFWLISLFTKIPLFVDESATIYRLSGLISEPSYVAIPSSILIVAGLIKHERLYVLLALISSILSFSPTSFICVAFSIFLYSILKFKIILNRLLLGRVKKYKKRIITVVSMFFCAFTAVSIPILQELYDNINYFIITQSFLDARATNAQSFYSAIKNFSPPIGFGNGSSEMVYRYFDYSGVFDNSIFVSIDMVFGLALGFILKSLYLLAWLCLIFYICSKSYIQLLPSKKFMLLWSCVWFIFSLGSYSQPYIFALLLFLIASFFSKVPFQSSAC